MAPPPAKKQKRLIVLSSDEDEDESQHAISPNTRSKVVATGAARKSDRQSIANVNSLPTRARAKPSPFAPRKDSRSSGKPTTNSSPSKPKRKGLEAGKLYTFFNTATQFQQADGAARASQASENIDDEDLIKDDTLDEKALKRSSAQKELQSTKSEQNRTRHISAEAFASNGRRPDAIQRFLPADRTKLPHASHGASAGLKETKPWAEIFGPTTLEELAVHKKKVADVRTWLDNVMDGKEYKVNAISRIYLQLH